MFSGFNICRVRVSTLNLESIARVPITFRPAFKFSNMTGDNETSSMASRDDVESLEAKIADLAFRLQISNNNHYSSSEDPDVLDAAVDEYRARLAHIAELHAELEKSGSTHCNVSEGICSVIHDQRPHQPFASLPSEILSYIFKKAPVPPNERMLFASNVSRVSCYWREAALKTPFLWSGLYLPLWATKDVYHTLLKIFIQRSQSHPLNIAVNLDVRSSNHAAYYLPTQIPQKQLIAACHRTPYRSDSATYMDPIDYFRMIHSAEYAKKNISGVQKLLTTLIPEIARWETFHYEGDHVLDILQPLTNLSAPILQSFDLVASGRGNTSGPLKLFDGGHTQMLSQVCIDGMQIAALLLPLTSITSLRLCRADGSIRGLAFLDILRSAVALVSLHLDETALYEGDLYPIALQGYGVEMASLRHFSYTSTKSPKYYLEYLLNTVCCPNLKSMALSTKGGSSPPDISSRQRMTLPLYPALHTLELHGFNCAEFVEHFGFIQLPALQSISLVGCHSPMALLCTLLSSESRIDGLWPSLRAMKLSHLGATDFDSLCEIISFRHANNRPMEVAQIDPYSLEQFPDKVEWMRERLTIQKGRHVNNQHSSTIPIPDFWM